MPGSERQSWRRALLSERHGLATIAVRDGRVHELNAAAERMFGRERVGAAVEDLFEESCRAKVTALIASDVAATADLEVSQAAGPIAVRFVVLTGRRERLLVATATTMGYTEALGAKLVAANSSLANLTRELSRRVHELDAAKQALLEAHETEQRLRTELEELGRASSAVAEAALDAPRSDVSAVLHMIALQARELTHADYVALGVGSDPSRPFDPFVAIGMSPSVGARIGRVPHPVGLLGKVARDGDVVRTADARTQPGYRGLPAHHPEIGCFLGVPIHRRGRPVGNLYLAKKPGSTEFTARDERLIAALAARVAVAIETAVLCARESVERAWLQNTIDQMPGGVLVYDQHGRLKVKNQAISALGCTELDRSDAEGNPNLCARWPDGRIIRTDDMPVVRAFRGEEVVHQEVYLCQAKGGLLPVSMSAVPVRDAEGKVIGVTMIVDDLSEQKQLERLREEWAAVIAHDLRQPGGTISLAAEALLRLPLSDGARRYVERIKEASRRMNRMIADLMDSSRIESKRLSVDAKMIDLRGLVDAFVVGAAAMTSGHPLEVNVEGEPYAWIDPDRIDQVLGNLVSNAAKYSDPGTSIHLDVVARDDVVEVIVTNQGAGIPPDQLPLLFRRFARMRQARASGASGLGLGLYISKGLVEAHGGRLWAESVPRGKTAFHFTMPAALRPARAEAALAPPK